MSFTIAYTVLVLLNWCDRQAEQTGHTYKQPPYRSPYTSSTAAARQPLPLFNHGKEQVLGCAQNLLLA
jgi:hypothetical protein